MNIRVQRGQNNGKHYRSGGRVAGSHCYADGKVVKKKRERERIQNEYALRYAKESKTFILSQEANGLSFHLDRG